MSQQQYANLSEFIAFLESKGELARITTPVSCELEITEITEFTEITEITKHNLHFHQQLITFHQNRQFHKT